MAADKNTMVHLNKKSTEKHIRNVIVCADAFGEEIAIFEALVLGAESIFSENGGDLNSRYAEGLAFQCNRFHDAHEKLSSAISCLIQSTEKINENLI